MAAGRQLSYIRCSVVVPPAAGDACVLINGWQFEMRPLSSYNVDDIEMLEIYPSKSEDTKTVRDHMSRPCEEKPDGGHLTWYVLWLKGHT